MDEPHGVASLDATGNVPLRQLRNVYWLETSQGSLYDVIASHAALIQEVQELKATVATLTSKLEQLTVDVMYAPGGPMMERVQKEYEERQLGIHPLATKPSPI
jgi:hypothetical protein